MNKIFNNKFFIPLEEWGLLTVTGEDSEAFLQGQLTCDVKKANAEVLLLGARCNPKGRVEASFQLWKKNTTFYLSLPKRIIASLQATLQKYILFSKVTLTDETEKYWGLALSMEAAALLCKKFSSKSNLIQFKEKAYPAILWLPIENKQDAQILLESQAFQRTPTTQWQALAIEQQISYILPETHGKLTPHDLNYPEIGAISFDKGCYCGQEIIARMHYRGKPKQHLYKFECSKKLNLQPGLTLTNGKGQPVGLITTVFSEAEKTIGLASVKDKSIENKDACVEGTTLTWCI